MRYYPMNVDVAGRACTVVGGGRVAERKTLVLLSAGAAITIISPDLTERLRELASDGKLTWRQRCWQAGDMAGCFLAICATDRADVNAAAAAEARRSGALVNVVDNPDLGDFVTPSLLSRGELLITVSTGGASPMLARRIKEQLDQLYGEQFGQYLQEIANVREQMKDCLANAAEREAFWRLALDEQSLELVRQGKVNEAKEKIIGETTGGWNRS